MKYLLKVIQTGQAIAISLLYLSLGCRILSNPVESLRTILVSDRGNPTEEEQKPLTKHNMAGPAAVGMRFSGSFKKIFFGFWGRYQILTHVDQ